MTKKRKRLLGIVIGAIFAIILTLNIFHSQSADAATAILSTPGFILLLIYHLIVNNTYEVLGRPGSDAFILCVNTIVGALLGFIVCLYLELRKKSPRWFIAITTVLVLLIGYLAESEMKRNTD